ncbi:hypothetical protein NM688_g1238 [Phlebia brevispora]|uniref:Uncharacterized protein n=1 Tax=Phlebia brevispora TaxID=194682 RepID=A0ACC1TCD6_9APHY|nr:hypothetical protein NM688_g1238 [Phlebia brevispora]
MSDSEVKYYHHGRFAVAGGTLPDAVTAYKTYGDPKNPCIAYGVCFGGRIDDKGPFGQDWLIGEGLPLDPSKYFIVTFALFGNGQSSSPSNTPAPHNGPYFPRVTYEDNIRAQYNVITKGLNISRIFCVIGFSMGGQQAYYWATMYPDFVERMVCICGAARTSVHSKCLVESMKYAMKSGKDFQDGYYTSRPRIAISAAIRILYSWCYSFEVGPFNTRLSDCLANTLCRLKFWNDGLYLGGRMYKDLDDWLLDQCDGPWGHWDANDILTLANTWQAGDISKITSFGPSLQGDITAALTGIKATALLLPAKGDFLFPPEDNEKELQSLKNTDARIAVIPSTWGHGACVGVNPADTEFIIKQLEAFFAST